MSRCDTKRCTTARRPLLLAVLCVFGFAPVHAHIKNEASQFPDIEFSDARSDVVVLVGAGIIPETPVFEPDKPLSRKELAAWAALANGLGKGGETPDTDALAAAGAREKLVTSLEGDASYAEVNAALFGGKLAVESPAEIPTKAQAARWIAAQLSEDAGRELLERRELRLGVTGVVEAVEAPSEQGHHGHNGHGHNGYVITVGGVTRKMHEHGRVANGPTDLLQWKGMTVRRSVESGTGDDAIWIYLEAELPQAAAPDVDATAAAEAAAAQAGAEQAAPNRTLLYGLIAAVLILGVVLFVRRRRS